MTAQATICSTEEDGWAAIERHLYELLESNLIIYTGWLEEYSPAIVTPLPHGEDVLYDPARVERVVRTLNKFDQIKGRWGGHPLKLFDWQLFYEIAPIFGIVRWHDDDLLEGDEPHEGGGEYRRITRTAWLEKPRKNGKSTECSGLGLVLAFADGEPGAEVYAAARNRDQAKIVFAPAVTMASRCDMLRRKLGARNIKKNLIENPNTSSIFRPVASDLGGSLHGLNVHGGIVDEVHIHKTPDTIDAIETGTGSRSQPLVIFITTADEGITGSIYDTKRSYVEAIAEGHAVDESFYGVVFAASEEDIAQRPFEESTLRAANPGCGYTVTLEYLKGKAREAKSSPAQLNRYLRLHLGKRTKQAVRWFTMQQWDIAQGMTPTLEEWRRAPAWGGIDLSATTDFTAATILAVDRKNPDGYIGHAMFWIPEERVDDLAKLCNVPLRQWAEEGWLTLTEGNVVDYAVFREDLLREIRRLNVVMKEIAYDPWNAAETVQAMIDDRRMTANMIPLRQGYASLSGPSKELERLVMGSTPEAPLLRFGWNPVLRWMADCVEVMQDPAGNIKPTKPDRRASAKRIDGIASTVDAIARAMVRPKRRKRAGGVA